MHHSTASTAAGTYTLTIQATNGSGTVTQTFTLTVLTTPAITTVNPSTGPVWGTTIALTGTGFTGATSVTVNGVATTFTAPTTDTSITGVTIPAGVLGPVNITVTAPGGTSGPATFTYVAVGATSLAVVNGGGPIGDTYAVGDTLTLVGGGPTAGVLTVAAVAGGKVTGVTVANPGYYTSVPANPVSTTDSTGTATGATFNLTISPLFYAAAVTATIPGNSTPPTAGGLAGTSTNVLLAATQYTSTSNNSGSYAVQFNSSVSLNYSYTINTPIATPSPGDSYNVIQVTVSQNIASGTFRKRSIGRHPCQRLGQSIDIA